MTEIAYLGPKGTYCNEAARIFAERLELESPDYHEFSSFGEIFDAVDRGRCEYGVVATENSLEGPVTATLDSFAFKGNFTILGEEVLDIHHCLILHPDSTIEDIRTVASHTQGLGQCRRYLSEKLPGRPTVTTSSTAESVRMAMEDPSVASIANSFAADLYGARVIQPEVEDHFGNQTSFALIARQGHEPVFSGTKYKTSLALFLRADKAGALLMILSEFAYANINMTMIQSRPTKQALGDYMFFANIEGNVEDANIQTALNCLKLKLREVKVLGSYPTD